MSREKDTDNPTIAQTDPARNSTIRKMEGLRISFSEAVNNAGFVSNYSLTGAGVGTLAISGISVVTDSEVVLQFSGIMIDGSISLKLSNIIDKVGNTLQDNEILMTSDAIPKWRYIGRAVSRRTIAVNFGPSVAYDSKYIYAAITESTCFNGTTSQTDISVMRHEFTTGNWSVVGDYCLSGGGITATSVFPSLLLHNGSLFVAFTDGGTFDGTNKFVRVRVFKNGQWEILGTPLPAQMGANTTNSSITADGDNIYVALRDLANGNRLSVYRNTITTPGAWTLMGTNGLSVGNIFRAAPLVVYNNELYVGFRDGGSVGPASKPSVLKWDGTSAWSTTGAVDTLASDFVNMLKTPTDLWLIYQQGGTAAVAAMKFSAGTWSSAFANLTTEGTPNYLSAAIQGNNVYVGYQVSSTATCWVKKQDSTTWAALGPAFNCGNPTIIYANGSLHAVFRDKDTNYVDMLSAAYFQ